MATCVLGISAFYHDSAAALVIDGRIVAAAQEERFTRKKHDPSFPANAMAYCLEAGGIEASQLDLVVFYDKPLLKFDRLMETYLAHAPRGLQSFMAALPQWLRTKLHLRREIERALGKEPPPLAFTRHHESHAACAFYPSPFAESAILTIDGVGEWDTASIGVGQDREVTLLRTMAFPHSLGLLYSAFTYFCGFRVNSGEYKLMGLAPYGTPRYAGIIRDRLLDLRDDGSFRISQEYFRYAHGLTMTGPKMDALFGGPPRKPESTITMREMDLAASIQKVTEEIVVRMATTAQRVSGSRKLCLAGGVALNCVANGVLQRKGIFDKIWIPGPAGDAGGALGAALFGYHELLGQPRTVDERDSMGGCLLGPAYTDQQVQDYLKQEGISHRAFENEDELLGVTASALAEGKVVGWFHGRMEFGPRALGARSILGDARNPRMQSQMNLRIKFRESFRPFAPAVLAEDVSKWFEMEGESPYMLLVAAVKGDRRLPLTDEQLALQTNPDLRVRVNVPRSEIPAVTHVDYSARVQTVDEHRHGRFWRLLREFKRQTGCGLVVNTSFNVRGEPIVCTPQDAYRCFQACDMDVLVLENCVLEKTAQPQWTEAVRERHLAGFSND